MGTPGSNDKEDDLYTDEYETVSDTSKFVDKVDNKLFQIHQIHEEVGSTLMLKCKMCGAEEFYVGVGSCFTAIKCKNCKWERCIHEG